MTLVQLALRNISGNAFRSWVVALCAMFMTCFALVTTLILRGAQNSLELALQRLGADILVVPQGTIGKVESALLMGATERVWMPGRVLDEVAAVPGVEQASPQIYLSTLKGASCCSVEDMFLIAFDPATDFTVQPWLLQKIGGSLKLGEVVGGTYVFTPEGQNIKIYGYLVTLVANMEPTGTGLDQTMFLTMETAKDVARLSTTLAEAPLVLEPDSISAVLVRLEPGADPQAIALEIMHRLPGMTPVTSSNLFHSYRQQLSTLLKGILTIMGVTLGISLLLMGLVFSLVANERRREMGVLRALGARRKDIFMSLLLEGGMVAMAGGLAGAFLTTLAVYLFRHLIVTSLGLPFLLPSPLALAAQIALGLAISLLCVSLASLIPALRISLQDPATAMRE